MSNQSDRFLGGFVAGTIFGSIAGGLLGAWLGTRLSDRTSDDGLAGSSAEGPVEKVKRKMLNRSQDLTIEDARQGLEEKIAQLNDAIDVARQQLSKVNGTSQEP